MIIRVTKDSPWLLPLGRYMVVPLGTVGLEIRSEAGEWKVCPWAFGGGLVEGDGESVRLALQGELKPEAVVHVVEVVV